MFSLYKQMFIANVTRRCVIRLCPSSKSHTGNDIQLIKLW